MGNKKEIEPTPNLEKLRAEFFKKGGVVVRYPNGMKGSDFKQRTGAGQEKEID